MAFLFADRNFFKKHIDWVKTSPTLDIFGVEQADTFSKLPCI